MFKRFLVAIFLMFSSTWLTHAFTMSELDAADYLAKAGMIVDYSSTPIYYDLDADVLRQEIAGLALSLSPYEKESICRAKFKDVNTKVPNTWACYSIEGLLNNNLIAHNEYFRPEETLSKAEATWMIVKAVYGDAYSYDDTLWTSWEKQVVDFAVSKGITEDFSDFSLNATRWFVFKLAKNALVINNSKEHFGVLTQCALYWKCNWEKEKNEETPKLLDLTRVWVSNNNILVIPEENALMLEFDIVNNTWEEVYINSIQTEITNALWFTKEELSGIKLYLNSQPVAFSSDFNFDDMNVKLEVDSVNNFMIRADVLTWAVPWKFFWIAVTWDDIEAKNASWEKVWFTKESYAYREFTFFTDNAKNESETAPDNRDLTFKNSENMPTVEYVFFNATANDLYRFSIAPEDDIELTKLTLTISWDASFSNARFVIRKNKIDWPIVWTAEMTKDFVNWKVVFTRNKDFWDLQAASTLSTQNSKVWAFTKTVYFVLLDYIPSDVLYDNKWKTRNINISEIKYVDSEWVEATIWWN